MAVVKEDHMGLGKDLRLVLLAAETGDSDGGLARPHLFKGQMRLSLK